MALYLRKKLDNKAEIAVWQVTETEEELKQLCSVPRDEMEEIMLFRSESQRRQKLAVRALLNEVFEEKMYLNHHDNGQPYLENCVTNISITHTDKYVAIIIHDEEDLGIDIESLDRNFAAVEKKALSEDEIEDLDDLLRLLRADSAVHDSKVLRSNKNRTAFDGAASGHDAGIAQKHRLLHEAAVVEQQANALARGELAALLDLLDASGILKNVLLAREHLIEILKGAHSTIASVIIYICFYTKQNVQHKSPDTIYPVFLNSTEFSLFLLPFYKFRKKVKTLTKSHATICFSV